MIMILFPSGQFAAEVPWLENFLDLAGPRFHGWEEASRDYARPEQGQPFRRAVGKFDCSHTISLDFFQQIGRKSV